MFSEDFQPLQKFSIFLEWESHRSGTIAVISIVALIMAFYFIGRQIWHFYGPDGRHDIEKGYFLAA